MAYIPRLEDIEDAQNSQTMATTPMSVGKAVSGYEPSLTDIPESSSTGMMRSAKQKLMNLGVPLPQADMPQGNMDMSQAPWWFKKLLAIMSTTGKPMGEQLKTNLVNVGRGMTEVGQGVKQTAFGAGEYLGAVPYGTQADYTRQTEAERKLYESTPAAQDPYGREILRPGVTGAPFAAATMLPMVGEAGVMAKLLQGTVGGGLAKNIEYRQPGEDRFVETLKGMGEGALANLIPEAPGLIGKGIEKTKGTIDAFKANIPEMQAEVERLKAPAQAAELEHAEAKSLAKQSPLKKADVDIMQANLDENNAKLQAIDADLAAQQEGLVNPTQYFVDTPAEATSRLAKAENNHEVASQAVSDLKTQEKKVGELFQPHIENAQANIAKADEAIDTHLESGAEHDVKVAAIVNKQLEANKAEIAKGYTDLEKNLADQKIELTPESGKSVQEINDELRTLVSENKADSKEATDLLKQLDNIGKSEKVAANDVISTYQSINGYMRDAYKKGFQPGLNKEQQLHWQNVGAQLEDKLAQLDKILEGNLSKADYKLFKETGARWRKEVVPLYKNPVYHQIQKGKMPKNIMESLRGTDEGNVLIRNAIQNDPQALKHVVGQRYDVNPDHVLNPNEQVKGYTDRMPELQQLVQNRKAADMDHQTVNQQMAEQSAKIRAAREQAEQMQKRTQKHLDMQKEAKKQADKMRQDYDVKLGNIKNLQEQKASLEQTGKLLDEHIERLKKTAANKNQTAKELQEAQERLSKAESKRQGVKAKLKTLLMAGAGLTGFYGAYKVGRAIGAAASLPGEE